MQLLTLTNNAVLYMTLIQPEPTHVELISTHKEIKENIYFKNIQKKIILSKLKHIFSFRYVLFILYSMEKKK